MASDILRLGELQVSWKPLLHAGVFCVLVDFVFLASGSWHFQAIHLLGALYAVLSTVPGDPLMFLGRGAVALVLPSLSLGIFSWLFFQPGMFFAGILGQLGILGIVHLQALITLEQLVPVQRIEEVETTLRNERDNTLQLVLHFSLLGCMRNTERVFHQAMHILQTHFHFQQAVLYMAHPAASEFRPVKTLGFSSDRLEGLVISVPPEFWKAQIIDHEQGIMGVLAGEPRLPRLRDLIPSCGLDSMGALPIAVNGRILGLLNFVKQKADGVRHQQAALLATFGHLLGSAFFNCRTHEANLQTISHAQRNRADLLKAVSRLVAPSVIKQLESKPELLSLGGKRMTISVMMADLRGFTALSADLPLETTCQLLNEWFTQATRILFEAGGTLDKFLGDGLLVLFGAPLPGENDARLAVQTARKLQTLFASFVQAHQGDLNGRSLGLGIAVATGEAVVGNFGAAERMEYTAIGSPVNLAARLEKLAGSGEIVVDERTYRFLPKHTPGQVLEQVPIKGQHAQTIYRLASQ